MLAHIGLIIALGITANSPIDNPAKNDDLLKQEYARFEGVWSLALVEVDGVKQPAASFESTRVIILKDGHFVVVQGPRITHGVFKLDVTKSPKQWDQTATLGAKTRTVSCIYELDADSYKLCGSVRGNERPTTFGSTPGSGLIYQVLKRENQSVKSALADAGRRELAGTWQAVSYALDGKPASSDDMKQIKLIIDAQGKTSAFRGDQLFIASTTEIDPSQSPMTMDITFTIGDNNGKTALGIYKIEGGVLTICRSGPGQPRPNEFASDPGSGHTLMSYRKER
jgi:uncharacterized protein (TIGR03067 family)